MDDGAMLQIVAEGEPQESIPAAETEALEVAGLLAKAGVDHASSLWFQLVELATQCACEWSERAQASCAPLSARAAAILGLRTLAAAILSEAQDRDDSADTLAAEACLGVCAEAETREEPPPPASARPRRWGEGAIPRRPAKTRLLPLAAGCC